jgi:hypothetical protein
MYRYYMLQLTSSGVPLKSACASAVRSVAAAESPSLDTTSTASRNMVTLIHKTVVTITCCAQHMLSRSIAELQLEDQDVHGGAFSACATQYGGWNLSCRRLWCCAKLTCPG